MCTYLHIRDVLVHIFHVWNNKRQRLLYVITFNYRDIALTVLRVLFRVDMLYLLKSIEYSPGYYVMIMCNEVLSM